MRFHNSPHELDVTYHTDATTVAAYSRLSEVIEMKVKEDGHDFVHYVFGVPGTSL